jgi:threonine synthase
MNSASVLNEFPRRSCEACGTRFEHADLVWRCRCGGMLSVDGMVPFSEPLPAGGVWRYSSSLPRVPQADRVNLGEGMTPLIRVHGFRGDVHAKLEFVSPTGSFKDRGNAVGVSRLKQLGVARVVEDSSGNAGASLAAYCAAAGIRCTIYVPATASPGKLVQIRAYGAEIVQVPGPRAAATDAALAAATETYYANHTWDPFFFEGTKTAAFEIVEQLRGHVPARVLLPVGQGTMLLGMAKGFRELLAAGRIGRLPQLVAVQSDACAPICEVICRGLAELPAIFPPERVVAEGIATAHPLRWRSIVKVLHESGGTAIGVPEASIPSAVSRLGRLGLFVEPTSAIVLPALEQLLDQHGHLDGTTVMLLTGAGLKASAAIASWLST